MKRLSILLVLTICFLNNVVSQEKSKSKEIGIYFSNLDAFGIRYKSGNEKTMFRLTAVSLSIGSSSDDNGSGISQDRIYSGFGLNLGLEFPVKINDQFNFYYGGELQTSYYYDKTKITGSADTKTNTYGAGLGFIMGFSYTFKSNISLSAEIVPSFNYRYSKMGERKYSSYGFGLSNNSAGITIGYKF